MVVLALYTAMDRQVLGLLAEPLRRDLGLDDTQFGLMQGAGVAVFAALAGYPLAWLADRSDRRYVLAACMSCWCFALVACAQASSFMELFAVSSLMGAAEAGVVPIAYALIADWFGARKRQTANSIFVLFGRIGAGVMIAASGWLVASVDDLRSWLPPALQGAAEWRLTLMFTALPSLLIIPLLLTMPRVGTDGAGIRGRFLGLRGSKSVLEPATLVLPGILFLVIGAAMLSAGAAAVGVFMPVLVQRLAGLTPAQAGSGLGLAALSAALTALAVSSGLAKRNSESTAGATGMRVAALGMVIAALAGALLVATTAVNHALLLYACLLAGTMTAAMLLVGVLQAKAPQHARTRFMAVFVGAAAVAAALSPILVGAWSDAGGATPVALARAMAFSSAPCFVGAALAFALAAKVLVSKVN
nr:MFS transporter [Roseateles albus]